MTRAELADPATRSIGMARLIGQLSAYGLTIGFAQAVNAALGIEDEEVEAMREMVPPWAQNSPLIVMKDNDGKYSYIDLGYTDPHAMFFKPFMGLLRGETIQESLFGSSDGFHRGLLREAIEPFVGEDMVFGSLLDAYRGRDGNGVPLYSEGDPRMVKFQKIAEHLFDDLQPGFIKQLYTVPKNYLMGKTDKYGNVYDLPSHMLSVATGVKQQPINLSRRSHSTAVPLSVWSVSCDQSCHGSLVEQARCLNRRSPRPTTASTRLAWRTCDLSAASCWRQNGSV